MINDLIKGLDKMKERNIKVKGIAMTKEAWDTINTEFCGRTELPADFIKMPPYYDPSVLGVRVFFVDYSGDYWGWITKGETIG